MKWIIHTVMGDRPVTNPLFATFLSTLAGWAGQRPQLQRDPECGVLTVQFYEGKYPIIELEIEREELEYQVSAYGCGVDRDPDWYPIGVISPQLLLLLKRLRNGTIENFVDEEETDG